MFKVMEKSCDECLFSKNRVVSAKRKADILRDCAAKDCHFICHKATARGEDVCCRGFFASRSTNLIRIAGRLGAIEFVKVSK